MTTEGQRSAPTALVISPRFFWYEAAIMGELERQGVVATFLDERFSNSSIARAVLRRAQPLARRWTDRYYRQRLKDIGDTTFDLVLIVKGEDVPRWFLEKLKERNPTARIAFYAWDSIANSHEFLPLMDLFDEAFTFDRRDAAADSRLQYQPFFFAPEFAAADTGDRPLALTFVGTLHSNRHRVARRVLGSLPATETRCFFYSPARWYFFVRKYLTRDFRDVAWGDVSFTAMTHRATAQLFRSSRAVLDVHHPNQSGLSPRVFEVLAAGCALVTTNSSIELEPIFDSGHVIVIPMDFQDRDGAELAARLELLPTYPLTAEQLAPYSITAWVNRVALAGVAGRPQTHAIRVASSDLETPDASGEGR